jgi:hypothetical protein
MKAAIQVVALNIYGHGNPNVWHHDNRWFNIWSLMRDEKIGVLITAHERSIHFMQDPVTANGKGLASVLNKNMVKTQFKDEGNSSRTRDDTRNEECRRFPASPPSPEQIHRRPYQHWMTSRHT